MSRPPRLEACWFAGTEGDPTNFARLAAVLTWTARIWCAGWDVRIRNEAPPAPPGGPGVTSLIANTRKLKLWADLVHEAPDGDRILFLDVDTAILGPLDAIWDAPFDLAYATKTEGFPFNLGVLFLRVSPATRALMAAWYAENLRLYHGGPAERTWRRRFGGMNQGAFARLWEAGRLDDLDVRALECRIWNCEDSAWAAFGPETRILHVKGDLRKAIFGRLPWRMGPPAALEPAVRAWRSIDRLVRAGRQEGA